MARSALRLPDGFLLPDLYERVPDDPVFREMRDFAHRFQHENRAALRYYARRWVAEPLHHWSRRWEYLYATQRVDDAVESAPDRPVRLLDAGAGLTFFAHWLAARHPQLQVHCADRDPRAARSARRLRPPASAAVSYATEDLSRLGHPDASFDVVVCVSVLEHARDAASSIVRELARVARPGGRLVLTIDVALEDRFQIPVPRALALLDDLSTSLRPDDDYAADLRSLDPDRVVTTRYVRDRDPSLLPWRWPDPADALRSLLRPRALLRQRFKPLTCLCMAWTRHGQEPAS